MAVVANFFSICYLKSMHIVDALLSYHQRLEPRDTADIDTIVIHCTELPTLEKAREFGEKVHYEGTQTGNSGHYYIDRDGAVYRYVPDNRTAHHAKQYNARSIGIELVNNGRYPHWFHSRHQQPTEPYPEEQIQALKELLQFLKKTYPQVTQLTRHSDLDQEKIKAHDNPEILINRKIDPGPLFPWENLLESWVSLNPGNPNQS